MTYPVRIRIAAILGFVGVALGAFGAHALDAQLTESGRLDTWETASRYHLIHALAMLVPIQSTSLFKTPALWFAIGVVIFSGSLYTLALTNIGVFGAITPLGGVAFLTGWTLLAIQAGKLGKTPST